MQETGNHISIKKTVSKSIIRHEVPQGCDLLALINSTEIRMAVTGHHPRQVLAYESWTMIDTEREISDVFLQISSDSKLLADRNYRNIICCSSYSSSVLIPNSLYIPSESAEQLQFSVGKNIAGIVLTDDLKHCAAKNIFSLPEEIYNGIVRIFPHSQLHHSTSAMIDYMLWKHRGEEEDIFLINVGSDYAEFVITRGKNLKLLNRYEYSTYEELVYYILFAMEQLQLNPDHVPLVFSGMVSSDDHAFKLAAKYIRNISLATMPDIVSGIDVLEEVPAHSCFNLFCQQICAS